MPTRPMLLHERWFTNDLDYPVQFGQAFTSRTWIPLSIALAATAAALLLWRARGRRALIPGPLELGMTWENYKNLLSWMPLVIGIHVAVNLLVGGVSLHLFVPNLQLPSNIIGAGLGLAEIVIALSFLYGALTRLSALLLAVTWLAGAIYFGPLRLLEHSFLLGVAFFLFATGRGPLAFDMSLERLHRPIERLVPHAVPVLRVLAGLSLAVVAFTEKLWNEPMGLAFLSAHPFNFFPALGMPGIGDREFIFISGIVELTLAMVLMSGAFVRLVAIIILVPFNLTLPLLGWRELVGHLPIYGILALLAVWGEEQPSADAALVRGLTEHADDSARSGASIG